MTVTYGIVEEKYSIGENTRISYGISVTDYESGAEAAVVCLVHDITSDKAKLQELVRKCNSASLSVIHFQDVIEDFLAEI